SDRSSVGEEEAAEVAGAVAADSAAEVALEDLAEVVQEEAAQAAHGDRLPEQLGATIWKQKNISQNWWNVSSWPTEPTWNAWCCSVRRRRRPSLSSTPAFLTSTCCALCASCPRQRSTPSRRPSPGGPGRNILHRWCFHARNWNAPPTFLRLNCSTFVNATAFCTATTSSRTCRCQWTSIAGNLSTICAPSC